MSRPASPNPNRSKIIALWTVGILTTIYVLVELGMAVWLKSLVLLSDGFHNLSDVVSIGIAYWSIVVRPLMPTSVNPKPKKSWKLTPPFCSYNLHHLLCVEHRLFRFCSSTRLNLVFIYVEI